MLSRPSRARGLKLFEQQKTKAKLLSRPSRARGLKHIAAVFLDRIQIVAPLAGAWIETGFRMSTTRSHARSRPSRARGLKQHGKVLIGVTHGVAPLAGAWIETRITAGSLPLLGVAPLAGAWIETHDRRHRGRRKARRAPRGRVD